MVIVGFFIGCIAGSLAMAIFAARSYDKGFELGLRIGRLGK